MKQALNIISIVLHVLFYLPVLLITGGVILEALPFIVTSPFGGMVLDAFALTIVLILFVLSLILIVLSLWNTDADFQKNLYILIFNIIFAAIFAFLMDSLIDFGVSVVFWLVPILVVIIIVILNAITMLITEKKPY